MPTTHPRPSHPTPSRSSSTSLRRWPPTPATRTPSTAGLRVHSPAAARQGGGGGVGERALPAHTRAFYFCRTAPSIATCHSSRQLLHAATRAPCARLPWYPPPQRATAVVPRSPRQVSAPPPNPHPSNPTLLKRAATSRAFDTSSSPAPSSLHNEGPDGAARRHGTSNAAQPVPFRLS